MLVVALKEHEVNDKDLMEGQPEDRALFLEDDSFQRHSFQTGKKALTFKSFKKIPIVPRNVVTPINNAT